MQTDAETAGAEPAESLAATASVRYYQLILPPGWVQYPVRRGLADRLFRHIESIVENPNRELMTQLRTSTHRAIKDLVERGGIDLFLPQQRGDNRAIPASLASNLVELGTRGVETALVHIARGREVEKLETNTGFAYRWYAPAKGKDELTGLESSNAFYLFPLPGETPRAAIMFTFGVLRTDDLSEDYLEVLLMLFDAMMQSLVWVDEGTRA